jgi:TonB family protein
MSRLDLISSPRLDKGRKLHRRAFLASCVFHGVVLCLILWLTIHFRSQILLSKSGSAPGSPSITLEKITIVSPPPQPLPKPLAPPPVSSAPAPTPPAIVHTQTPQLHAPESPPQPTSPAIPVLAAQPDKPAQPMPSTAAKNRTEIHSAAAQSPPKSATASSSSYAPGLSVLPHPPYPEEARELRRIGTVVMSVLFDDKGDVARAEVTETSGVPLLDSATLSYIRQHWHSAAYAGQTVSVPVQYKLENL